MPSTTVTFPAAEILRAQLASSESTVVQHDSEVHPYIAEELAGSELDGLGVQVGLTMALHKYKAEKRPNALYFGMLKQSMPKVVETLVADPQVRSQALEAIERIGF